MEKHRRQTCGLIDSRLLQEMTDAAQALKRSRGANRLAAIHRYVVALHRFTDRAIQRLAAVR